LPEIKGALSPPGGDVPGWRGPVRLLQQVWFRGRRQQPQGLALFERTKAATGSRRRTRLERINSERCRLFEGPRKSELTEARKTLAKKREGLARVLERLRSPHLIPGMARELRKHVAILAREIAELSRARPDLTATLNRHSQKVR